MRNIMIYIGTILFWGIVATSGKEMRGVWIPDIGSSIYDSKENIAHGIDSLRAYGINTVFVGVCGNGYTFYPSDVMESVTGYPIYPAYQNRDILAEFIAESHRVGIEVHAWFEYGFAAAYGGAGPILQYNPAWAGKRLSTGSYMCDDNFSWMSQAHPEVQEFLLDLILEIVDRYDVDGIHLDRIRYGNRKVNNNMTYSDFGYDDAHLERYRAEHDGQDPPANPADNNWVQWRSQVVNQFSKIVYDSVKARNPYLQVSNTPIVYPYGYQNFMQDWPQWIRDQSIDFVVPQFYRYDINSYINELNRLYSQHLISADYKGVFSGILLGEGSNPVYNQALAADFVKEYRKRGFEGGVFFYYEGVRRLGPELKAEVFQEWDEPPFRSFTWRPPAFIVDENSAILEGNWSTLAASGSAGYYSYDGCLLTTQGTYSAAITYELDVAIPAYYDLYFYQPYHNSLVANLTIQCGPWLDQTTVIHENTSTHRGWIHLGTFLLNQGRQTLARISSQGVPASQVLAVDNMMVAINRQFSPDVVSIDGASTDIPVQMPLEMICFPNPAVDFLHLKLRIPYCGIYSLDCYDISGRHVFGSSIPSSQELMEWTVKLDSELGNGIYFLRVHGAGLTKSGKFVRLK